MPPVIVDPGVERLLTGEMLEIRDLVLDRAIKVSAIQSVSIDQIRIRELYCLEEDWSKVIFEMCISENDETAFTFWEAVDDAVWDDRGMLSKSARKALDEDATIFVLW